MTMTKKRHDDRPARRRSHCKRLAVLGLLTLGSNWGCGQEMLRIPAGADGSLRGPAPIPFSAAPPPKAETTGPVALKLASEYGSGFAELFPVTYRESTSSRSHFAKASFPRPSHGENLLPGGLLAASEESQIPLPAPSQSEVTESLAEFTQQPPAYARQRHRDPAASPFQQDQIPPPHVLPMTPTERIHADPPPVQGSADLISACGLTKIAPPKRRDLTYFPGLQEASKATGIGMPISPSRFAKPQFDELHEASKATSIGLPIPPTQFAKSPPIAPHDPVAAIPSQPVNEEEVPTQPQAPVETPSQPAALTTSPIPPSTPAEISTEPPKAAEIPTQSPALAELPGQAPAATMLPEPASLPAQAPPPTDSVLPPPVLAEAPAQAPPPADSVLPPPVLAEAPAQAPPPERVEAPTQVPPPVEMPTELPASAEIPNQPAALPELPTQPSARTESPNPMPPPDVPSQLPPLTEIPSEPVVLTEGTKKENPGTATEDTSVPPPTPPKPGPEPQTGELNVACEETKIPPPTQAASQSHGQSGGKGPEKDSLPPLQIDPSVFGTNVELPAPPPLPSPEPTVVSTSECPACVILRKQKESDHWASGPVNQTVFCPSCQENQARSRTKPKPDDQNLDLDAALKGP